MTLRRKKLLRKRVRMHFKPETQFEASLEGLLVDIVKDSHYVLIGAELIAGRDVPGIESENQSLNPVVIPAASVLFWEVL